jgi:hypothetical protein
MRFSGVTQWGENHLSPVPRATDRRENCRLVSVVTAKKERTGNKERNKNRSLRTRGKWGNQKVERTVKLKDFYLRVLKKNDPGLLQSLRTVGLLDVWIEKCQSKRTILTERSLSIEKHYRYTVRINETGIQGRIHFYLYEMQELTSAEVTETRCTIRELFCPATCVYRLWSWGMDRIWCGRHYNCIEFKRRQMQFTERRSDTLEPSRHKLSFSSLDCFTGIVLCTWGDMQHAQGKNRNINTLSPRKPEGKRSLGRFTSKCDNRRNGLWGRGLR